MKLIIVDQKIPEEAKNKLSGFGKLMELKTTGITYDAISGHPDIFAGMINDKIIVAPNLPQIFKDELKNNGIFFETGTQDVGGKYPGTAKYNFVATGRYFIHHLKYSDPAVISQSEKLEKIHVGQAYTRCNLLALKNDKFITSDRGIEKTLKKKQLDVLYFNPAGIILPGFKNGFLGGCAGVLGDQIFIIGNLNFYPEGEQLRMQLSNWQYKIIELYDGPLFDGGGILFCS